MKVDVFFSPLQVDELALRGRTVVVIDVLRASTSIAHALFNGAKEIIPVPTVEAAMKIVGNLAGDVTLLGGERNGKMIEGFHLGNSPAEYTTERVRGKSIVFTSTNGSVALAKARYAAETIVCGFVNISPVAAYLGEMGTDLTILCAGHEGNFSIEDSVCAGMLLGKLVEEGRHDIMYGDTGTASLILYKNRRRSLYKMVTASEHGQYLKSIGFGSDLKLCVDVDAIPILPVLVGNVIKVKSVDTLAVPS
ncbi:MAG TPA: 2-phosphosulfolactate phosphatase [Bacteroidota bacterium]|nr:2-phosphosulfolactate phosphatase [Bacteroidota bacterium]